MAKHKTRRGSPLHITPSFHLFGRSRDLFLDNIWVFGPLFAFQFLFLINSWLTNPHGLHGRARWQYDVQSHAGGWTTPTFPNYSLALILGIGIFALVLLAVGIAVQIMLQQAQLDAADGKRPSLERSFDTVKKMGWRMLGLYLLVGLYIVAGLILLIIPGLIMIRRYFLSSYVMLDKKCGIKEAMDRSAAISKPYSGYVWGVIGVMVVISLLNVIPFIGGLAAFAGGALYSIAPALRYQELKKIG